MNIDNIIENIIDKHMFNDWQGYDLRRFIESIIADAYALRDMEDDFRFRHDTDWKDRLRYIRD